MQTINSAGYHDYEDVGLQLNDYTVKEYSDCCDASITAISRRCTKCLDHCDIYKKYFDGAEEVIIK